MKILFTILTSTVFLFLGSCHGNGHSSFNKSIFPSGKWSWESVENRRNAKITNREFWSVSYKNGKPVVEMDFFRLGWSKAGFPCSGSPSYAINIKYFFKVIRVDQNILYLDKPKVKHVQTPCDEDLPKYDNIQLFYSAGNRVGFFRNNKREKFLHEWSITGIWSWKRVSQLNNGNDQKVEFELWNLKQKVDGTFSGYYDRTVLRSSNNKRTYTCNGKTKIWFFARYNVEGRVFSNGRISMKETSVKLPKHEVCEPSGKRYLDKFSGVLVGDTIQIKSNEEQIDQILKRKYGYTPK